MSDEKIKAVGKNRQEKAMVIWNAANTLYGNYKPHEYELVIIPMTVIKRLHDGTFGGTKGICRLFR